MIPPFLEEIPYKKVRTSLTSSIPDCAFISKQARIACFSLFFATTSLFEEDQP